MLLYYFFLSSRRMSTEKYTLKIHTSMEHANGDDSHKLQALLQMLVDTCGSTLQRNLVRYDQDLHQMLVDTCGSTLQHNLVRFGLRDIPNSVKQYFQFMILKGYHNDHDGHLIHPTPTIDTVWGTHISDVRCHHQMCLLISETLGTSFYDSDHIGVKRFHRDARLNRENYGDNNAAKQSFRFMWGEDLL